MPTAQVTPEVLLTIATQIQLGEIKTLKIKQRQNGKHKGILFADYSLKTGDGLTVDDETMMYRLRVKNIIMQAAKAIAAGDKVRFELAKVEDAERERYSYLFEVR